MALTSTHGVPQSVQVACGEYEEGRWMHMRRARVRATGDLVTLRSTLDNALVYVNHTGDARVRPLPLWAQAELRHMTHVYVHGKMALCFAPLYNRAAEESLHVDDLVVAPALSGEHLVRERDDYLAGARASLRSVNAALGQHVEGASASMSASSAAELRGDVERDVSRALRALRVPVSSAAVGAGGGVTMGAVVRHVDALVYTALSRGGEFPYSYYSNYDSLFSMAIWVTAMVWLYAVEPETVAAYGEWVLRVVRD